MNFTQNLFFCFTVLSFVPLCTGMGSAIGSEASKKLVVVSANLVEVSKNLKEGMQNLCMNSWLDIKKTGIAAIACVGATAKVWAGTAVKTTYGVAIAHPYVAGTIAVGGLCYGGYRFYRSDLAERTALTLKQSEVALKESAKRIAEEGAEAAREVMARELLIKEKAAEVAREIMAREIRIKEEDARVALEIMQKSAKIRRVVTITATATIATAAGIGLGYAGYRLYKGIQEYRHKGQLERDLSAARRTLLDTIVINARGEIGLFGVPEGCQQAASALLALPGGEQTLEKIVGAYHNQRSPAAILP